MKDQEDIPADMSELIRLGTIATVDLDAKRCTVLYGDEDDDDGGATTPPIRWLAPRCGKTKVSSPPSVGEQVILLCPDGQLAAAVALAGIDQDAFPLPSWGLTEGVEFEDGARITYDPVGHALTATLPGGGTALIEAPGGMTIRGDVTVEGTITASEDVVAAGISLNSHKHGNVQAGSAQSGGPV
ncbi:phage baseplate assembly protein V [Novosphingobium sp. 11B]